MAKAVKLKDQTEVTIRAMREDDLERSLEFFRALPPDDLLFARRNVTSKEVVQGRIRDLRTGSAKRLVAELDGRIVADAALELSGHEWKEHSAELRLVVARTHQRKGLGMLMAREIYLVAAKEGVEDIVVKMMQPQTSARRIFRKLGFREEALLPNYVTDRKGIKRDLILMRCDLERLWRQMEELATTWDLQGGRA